MGFRLVDPLQFTPSFLYLVVFPLALISLSDGALIHELCYLSSIEPTFVFVLCSIVILAAYCSLLPGF